MGVKGRKAGWREREERKWRTWQNNSLYKRVFKGEWEIRVVGEGGCDTKGGLGLFFKCKRNYAVFMHFQFQQIY